MSYDPALYSIPRKNNTIRVHISSSVSYLPEFLRSNPVRLYHITRHVTSKMKKSKNGLAWRLALETHCPSRSTRLGVHAPVAMTTLSAKCRVPSLAITPIHRPVRGSMSGREKVPELSKGECGARFGLHRVR
jgi:hypothetical protein